MDTAANRLLLQFHITGRCNLRCQHCYRVEGDVEPLTFDDIRAVIEQFLDLLDEYNRRHGIRKKGQINLTGGEPFIREDIREIIDLLGSLRERVSFAFLSNGSFLDEATVTQLKSAGVLFVQLSLDGDRETHDALRAAGDHDRVLKTASFLEQCGIRTLISFTANRDNMHLLPTVADECRQCGVSKLWSDRLVPIGGGEDLQALAVTAEHLPAYLGYLKRARGGALTRLRYRGTEVAADRALQFQGGGPMYACSAAKSLITVDEFGRILPCRRMPIVCGDVFTATLRDVYFEHETFRKLRQPLLPRECAACLYASRCMGGARCQSYAAYGSFLRADPACPLKTP